MRNEVSEELAITPRRSPCKSTTDKTFVEEPMLSEARGTHKLRPAPSATQLGMGKELSRQQDNVTHPGKEDGDTKQTAMGKRKKRTTIKALQALPIIFKAGKNGDEEVLVMQEIKRRI
jgi:hypothetical protein